MVHDLADTDSGSFLREFQFKGGHFFFGANLLCKLYILERDALDLTLFLACLEYVYMLSLKFPGEGV